MAEATCRSRSPRLVNSLLTGLPAQSLICKRQRVWQKTVLRCLGIRAPPSVYTTPVVRQHPLVAHQTSCFLQICLPLFQGHELLYVLLISLITYKCTLLFEPSVPVLILYYYKCRTKGNCAFSHSGPSVWNVLFIPHRNMQQPSILSNHLLKA